MPVKFNALKYVLNLNYSFKCIFEMLMMIAPSQEEAELVKFNTALILFCKTCVCVQSRGVREVTAHHCSPIYDRYQTVHTASLTAHSAGTSAHTFVEMPCSPSWSRNFQAYMNFEISPLLQELASATVLI